MQGWYSRMVAIGLGLAVLGSPDRVMAQEEIIPAAKAVNVDWTDVSQDVLALAPELKAPPKTLAAKLSPDVNRRLDRFVVTDKNSLQPLALLGAVMTGVDPSFANVPIPVLLPVDTPRYVTEFVRSGGARPKTPDAFLSPAIGKMQFLGKTTGYDAILDVKPSLLPRRFKASANLVQVHLGGTGLLYEIGNGDKGDGDAQRGDVVDDATLQKMYPRLRRNVSEDGITYSFVKYGAPYFANISCANAPPYGTNVPCAEVEGILRTVLGDLRLVGGGPLPLPRAKAGLPPRPTTKSPTFTYYAPGNLLPGTSQDGRGGVTNRYLWGGSDLLFPIKLDPVHANSQNFMHGGNCYGPGSKISLGDGRYKCLQNPSKILEPREDNIENYSYPWRDNYCEERDEPRRQPRDCPAGGKAHEGQDIRPRACQYDGSRCKINLYDVVAVTKGWALWKPENNNVKFTATDDTGVYFVYLHMDPDALKRAGLKKGKAVPRTRGQKIGEVGNWMGTTPHDTTAHLHFEIRSQSNMCGEYGCTSAPYWTLIRVYEQLIGMQGTELP